MKTILAKLGIIAKMKDKQIFHFNLSEWGEMWWEMSLSVAASTWRYDEAEAEQKPNEFLKNRSTIHVT